MSGTTYTWIGGQDVNGADNWVTPANWTVAGGTGTFPGSAPTDVAIDNVDDGLRDAIISGGQTITITSLSIGDPGAGTVQGGHVIVGGSSAIGGGGGGALNVTGGITITSTNTGGAIVGGTNGIITAPSLVITGGTDVLVGGGGTFDVPNITNNGDILADGGLFDLGPLVLNATAITGAGILQVSGPSTLEINAATKQGVEAIVGTGQTASIRLDQPNAFTGDLTLTNSGSGAVDLFFKGQAPAAVTVNGGNLIVTDKAGTTLDTIPFTSANPVEVGVVGSSAAGFGEIAIVCYARGTRIRTPDGEVAIEKLKPGQPVVTASGASVPIIWIGRRTIDCRRHPNPELVLPIRIKAGAFGPGKPQRDLLVSPAHAIYEDGVLVPARFLLNGRNVVQESVASVEYFHIELAQHDVVLAEGLPAETYLENNDRNRFENGGGVMALHPDFARWNWDARAYAELVVTGPVFEAIKAKLLRNAQAKPRAPRRRAA